MCGFLDMLEKEKEERECGVAKEGKEREGVTFSHHPTYTTNAKTDKAPLRIPLNYAIMPASFLSLSLCVSVCVCMCPKCLLVILTLSRKVQGLHFQELRPF